ncbi:[citrate (pro-3S)-lyase] ligase [Clostridium rectalis]|uniref:[citrate (pro-3S)-lyase] ligase n=1 Tax=Clostridium rectalis TaxID=2040295 RepID=UPI000F63DE8F|nr:[citrate (pro-3S)-lyase] ligase [Clostridium rectalis]
MYGLQVKTVNLKREEEKLRVHKFLENFDLKLDDDVDYTLIIENQGEIKATCSKAKNIFKCFAISDELRGENVTSTLISALVDKLFEEGMYHSFVFTKPDKIKVFTSLNFKPIYEAEKAVFLEYGIYDINKSLNDMVKKYNINDKCEKGALVMNCNPFTQGHRYLIEKASKQCEEVLVFIVQEDKSLFPFEERYKLVLEGTKDLRNVKVIPGGEYIISSATFPTYFIRQEDVRLKAYAEIDAGIFGKYFGEKFNIKKRFVGEEPYCKVTKTYNETLKEVLPEYDMELIEIKRKEFQGNFISASQVRELIKENNINEVKNIVPEVTWKFLNTENGKEIMEKIKLSNSPH